MVLDRKTNFFPGQNWFSSGNQLCPREKLVVLLKTICLGKKMVFLHKATSFLGKSWFFTPKPSFS